MNSLILSEVCLLEIRGLRIRRRLFKESLLSNVRPRYLTVEEEGIGPPLRVTSGKGAILRVKGV
jgi:hypothetical protein